VTRVKGRPPRPEPAGLFHWTCHHGAKGILLDGVVRPNLGLSWWTDLGSRTAQTRRATVLTSNHITCDRMVHKFTAAEPDLIFRWRDWVRVMQPDPQWVTVLESNGAPDHWWVADQPVAVRLL